MSVTTTLPRLVGLLAVVGAIRLLPPTLGTPLPGSLPWVLATCLWLGAAIALIRVEIVPLAAGVLAGLSTVAVFLLPPRDAPDLALLAWVTLLLAVSEGRPQQRALLLRVCVTCVYAFTVLAKLNPTFLSGDQIWLLVTTRSQLGRLDSTLTDELAVAAALATIAVEACLAIGLWLRRTRRPTAIIGATFHALLVPAAVLTNIFGLALLIVLNGLLVACYLSFFDPDPLRPRDALAKHVRPATLDH